MVLARSKEHKRRRKRGLDQDKWTQLPPPDHQNQTCSSKSCSSLNHQYLSQIFAPPRTMILKLTDKLFTICTFIMLLAITCNTSFALLASQDQRTSEFNVSSSQSISGNMSAMMMNGQATLMTNTSLLNGSSNSTNITNIGSSNFNMNSINNQNDRNKTGQQQQQIQMSASRVGGSKSNYPAQQSSNPKANSNARVSPTNSPAFNSRQLKQGHQSRQQVDHAAVQGSSNKKGSDNQMAADDMHEAFMTIKSASTSVSADSSASSAASSPSATQPKVMSTSIDSNKQATAEPKVSTSHETSSPKQDNTVVSTSTKPQRQSQVAQISMPKSSSKQKGGSSAVVYREQQQQQQQQQDWQQSRATMHPDMQPRLQQETMQPYMQQQQQQQQRYLNSPMATQQYVEPDVTQGLQYEKSNGYSYEPSSNSGVYTHISPLSPAKQEILIAEQIGHHSSSKGGRQRQYNQQATSSSRASSYFDRSSSIFDSSPRSVIPAAPVGSASNVIQQQYEQQQQAISSSGSNKPLNRVNPLQLPSKQQQQQIESTQMLESGGGGGFSTSSRQPTAIVNHPHPHSAGFPMMPIPHLSITGTPANPCKPPAGLHQDTIQQLINSNEIGAGFPQTPQAIPNFSSVVSMPAKYTRAKVGIRLRSQYIFKVIRTDSLTDCEAACTKASQVAGNNPQDACQSFNYRAYFAAENCELSRHDTRSLKLDDSAHFEQNTQFDFYTLEPPQAAMNNPMSAALMATSSSSNSLVYSPFPEADCLDVSQSCTQDGMEFTLRTSEPFNGRIYTYGFYDSCFTDGEGSTTSMLKISRSNGFPRCGTQQLGDLMTNIVVVQFNDYVQTTRDKKYNLTCYFSGPGEAVVTSNYLDTKIDERSHPIQIEHLPPQNVVTSNVHLRILYRGQPTNTIAVGDLLTFRLELQSNLNHHHRSANIPSNSNEIFATNVLAKDPYSGRQVQLIDSRGCPIDPVNVFPELQRTPDGALESEFYAFKIPDSNFLIFQATVRTCKAPCEPVICQSPSSGGGYSTTTRHPNQQQQQYQTIVGNGGEKGAASASYLMQSAQAYHPHLHNQHVPSWGKRRRRRWSSLFGAASIGGDSGMNNSNNNDDDETADLLSTGETIEHVIPARFQVDSSSIHRESNNNPREIKTIRRPELSEAEEEVKEMFRVYLSRAEINRQQRERQMGNYHHHHHHNSPLLPLDKSGDQIYSQSAATTTNTSETTPTILTTTTTTTTATTGQQQQLLSPFSASNTAAAAELSSLPLIGIDRQQNSFKGEHLSATLDNNDEWLNDKSKLLQAQLKDFEQQVCMTQSGYYVMLFTVISLSMVMLSVLFVSLYITKKAAKVHISDSIADSIF